MTFSHNYRQTASQSKHFSCLVWRVHLEFIMENHDPCPVNIVWEEWDAYLCKWARRTIFLHQFLQKHGDLVSPRFHLRGQTFAPKMGKTASFDRACQVESYCIGRLWIAQICWHSDRGTGGHALREGFLLHHPGSLPFTSVPATVPLPDTQPANMNANLIIYFGFCSQNKLHLSKI